MVKTEKSNRLILKGHYKYFIVGLVLLALVLGWSQMISVAVENRQLRIDRSQVHGSIQTMQKDNFYTYAPEHFKKEADKIKEASKP